MIVITCFFIKFPVQKNHKTNTPTEGKNSACVDTHINSILQLDIGLLSIRNICNVPCNRIFNLNESQGKASVLGEHHSYSQISPNADCDYVHILCHSFPSFLGIRIAEVLGQFFSVPGPLKEKFYTHPAKHLNKTVVI